MDLSESDIRLTVRFDRPISGPELVAAVRTACEQLPESRFYEQRKYDDGWFSAVGRGALDDGHFVVAPDRDNAFIDHTASYAEVVITETDAVAPVRRYATNPMPIERRVELAQQFAGSLRQAANQPASDPGLQKVADILRDQSAGPSAQQSGTAGERAWPPGGFRQPPDRGQGIG